MNTGNFNVSADTANQKLYAIPKLKQDAEQKEDLQKQDPSQTGLQWAQAANPQNLQQANIQPKQTVGRTLESKSAPEIVAPSIEDMAFITTQVSIRPESVESPVAKALNFMGIKFNIGSLEESFKEYFKKSKSHNLLLERFMSNIKFSSIKMLLSALGVSAEEQTRMQSEVKEEALKEIELKLSQDWAYTKAMMEITT